MTFFYNINVLKRYKIYKITLKERLIIGENVIGRKPIIKLMLRTDFFWFEELFNFPLLSPDRPLLRSFSSQNVQLNKAVPMLIMYNSDTTFCNYNDVWFCPREKQSTLKHFSENAQCVIHCRYNWSTMLWKGMNFFRHGFISILYLPQM